MILPTLTQGFWTLKLRVTYNMSKNTDLSVEQHQLLHMFSSRGNYHSHS